MAVCRAVPRRSSAGRVLMRIGPTVECGGIGCGKDFTTSSLRALRAGSMLDLSDRIQDMGILKKLFGSSGDTSNSVTRAPQDAVRSEPRVQVGVSMAVAQDLVQLTGTTTFARDATTRLAERHRIAAGGYLEVSGTIQREPENPADPHAIAVHVEGEKVGYLPGYLARTIDLPSGGAQAVQIQIFTELLPKGLRAEAWAWLGRGPAKWQYSETERPPMSSSAKAAAHQTSIDQMVTDALAGGGDRAESFHRGLVGGVHYLQLVEPIKQLKRDGRLDDALVLCYAAIEGAEGARNGLEPAPFYTEQAAIIHRKLGQRDKEAAVLRRWLAYCPPDRRKGSSIKERLDRLTG